MSFFMKYYDINKRQYYFNCYTPCDNLSQWCISTQEAIPVLFYSLPSKIMTWPLLINVVK